MYTEIFTLHAELLKALAHSRRLEIIQLLRDGEVNVSQMVEMLALPQSNLSQHLQILRQQGLVVTRKRGKEVFYAVAHPNIITACDAMRDILIERYKHSPLADEMTKNMQELLPVVEDPICKMRISPKTASFALTHNDHTYYFCASGCLEKFKKGIQ